MLLLPCVWSFSQVKLIAEVIYFGLNLCNRQCFFIFLKLGMRYMSRKASIAAHHGFNASTDVFRNRFEVPLRPFAKCSQRGFGGVGSFLYNFDSVLSRSLPAGVLEEELTLFHVFGRSHCFHVLLVVQLTQDLIISGALNARKSRAADRLLLMHQQKQSSPSENHMLDRTTALSRAVLEQIL